MDIAQGLVRERELLNLSEPQFIPLCNRNKKNIYLRDSGNAEQSVWLES